MEGVGYMTNITHDTRTEIEDKAVLVSLVTDAVKRSGINPEHSLQELVQLAETAGVEVLDVITQNREVPIPSGLLAKERSKSCAWQLMAWAQQRPYSIRNCPEHKFEFGRDTRCKIIDGLN